MMIFAYVAALVIWFPWRHRSANLFDLLICCFLLFFCGLSCPFSQLHDGWINDSIADFATVVTFSPIVLVVVLVIWVAWRRLDSRSAQAQQAKRAAITAGCRAVFTKFIGLQRESSQAFVHDLSARDLDVLRDACGVIVAELLGHQPGDVGLPWRLVHQEQKSGALTWSAAKVSSNAVPADSNELRGDSNGPCTPMTSPR